MDFPDDQVMTLSSGRKVTANNGYVGINQQLDTSEGHDSYLSTEEWTLQEKIELADHMIALWEKFKEEE